MFPVKITPDHLFVKTPFHDRDKVKDLLNGVWSKKEGMYRFPKNLHAMKEILRAYPPLQTNKEFMQLGAKLRKARDIRIVLKRMQDFPDIDDRLRPYQRVDVNYLKSLPSAGIFNEPRTGKTPTSIILMKELGTKSNLIVAPASLTLNWVKEFETWFPEMEVYHVNGTATKRKATYARYNQAVGRRVMVISKDTWKSDYEKLGIGKTTFDAVFVDEAHFLRNRDSAQSKAIFAIQSGRRYALTGTPTVKHGTDIFGILKFLYPSKFTSYWQFVERYWNMGQDWMGHSEIKDFKPERKQELTEMLGFMSVQRKRSEVMSWLPDKERITFYCAMDGRQLTAYNDMVEDFFTEIDDEESLDAPNVLTQLMRLRQLCLDPRLVGIEAPSAKTKALLEWLDNNREPVVIMSMFTSYFDLVKKDIEKLGLKVGMIHGKMSNADKEKAKVDFQNGKLDVLLCNIISAGVGFTLDRAETILFLDKAWNPADNDQAEDRITSTTKERNHKHSIISFVASGSVDERINTILEEKRSLTDIVNNGGREAIKRLLG